MMEHVEESDLSPEITRETRPVQSLESIERTSRDRNGAIRRAYTSAAYSMTEITRYFGVHISTASRIARSVDVKVKS